MLSSFQSKGQTISNKVVSKTINMNKPLENYNHNNKLLPRYKKNFYQTLCCLLTVVVIYLLTATSCLTNAFYIDQKQSPSTHDWSYNKQQEWSLENKQCSFKAQSPIDIQRRFVIPNNQLKLHFYNYNQLTKFRIQNAHHTIKLDPIYDNQNEFGIKLIGSSGTGSGGNDMGMSAADLDGNSSNMSDIITADDEVEAVVLYNKNNDPTGQQQQQQQNNSNAERSRVIVHKQNGNVVDVSRNEHSSSDGSLLNSLESEQTNANQNEQQPYNGYPTIKLDWLDDGNNEYKLRDIHFHWAERRDNGSEHAIDGRRAAMEMHLVHIKHGLDKSKIGFTSDSVTVIAVLIESYRKSNADFNPIVNALTRINMTNEALAIEYKSINDLLPNDMGSFYTYSGSLTTPPCYQVVNWIVMNDRLYMNAKQLEMFRNLYAPLTTNHEQPLNNNRLIHSSSNYNDDHEEQQQQQHPSEPLAIMPNIRQLQPLNNRTILASFMPLGKLEQLQINPSSPSMSSQYSSSMSLRQQNQNNGPLIMIVASVSFVMTIMPVLSLQ